MADKSPMGAFDHETISCGDTLIGQVADWLITRTLGGSDIEAARIEPKCGIWAGMFLQADRRSLFRSIGGCGSPVAASRRRGD